MLNIYFAIKLAIEAFLVRSFGIKSQKGVTMIEYALIAALIAIAVIVILGTLGTNLNDIFTTISGSIENAGAGS